MPKRHIILNVKHSECTSYVMTQKTRNEKGSGGWLGPRGAFFVFNILIDFALFITSAQDLVSRTIYFVSYWLGITYKIRKSVWRVAFCWRHKGRNRCPGRLASVHFSYNYLRTELNCVGAQSEILWNFLNEFLTEFLSLGQCSSSLLHNLFDYSRHVSRISG